MDGGCQGLGNGGNGDMLVKGYKLLVIRWLNSAGLMYNTAAIVNNNVLYTWNLLGELDARVLTTKKNCEVINMRMS